jgi:guanylate kinase
MPAPGTLFIVSGPSGSGKSTVASSVLSEVRGVTFSVSYTTRAPRGQEQDGVEYNFVSEARFKELLQEDALLEWALVYDNYYGTSRRLVDEAVARGDDVLLDLDVQGAGTIRSKRRAAVSVFILPPSYQSLRERLERRALDKHYVIEQRLKIACEEVKHYRNYDYIIVNDELNRAVEELKAIILASRCRMSSQVDSAKSVLSTFGGVDG